MTWKNSGACATSTRWTSGILPSTTSCSTRRSSRSTRLSSWSPPQSSGRKSRPRPPASSSWPTGPWPLRSRWRLPPIQRRGSTGSRWKPRPGSSRSRAQRPWTKPSKWHAPSAGCVRSRHSRWTFRPSHHSSRSRTAIRAQLLRWRPRLQGSTYRSTPHLQPSGAASHLDPSHRPAPVVGLGLWGSGRTPEAALVWRLGDGYGQLDRLLLAQDLQDDLASRARLGRQPLEVVVVLYRYFVESQDDVVLLKPRRRRGPARHGRRHDRALFAGNAQGVGQLG